MQQLKDEGRGEWCATTGELGNERLSLLYREGKEWCATIGDRWRAFSAEGSKWTAMN